MLLKTLITSFAPEMQKIKFHNPIFHFHRNFIWLVIALFSFAPCSVKEQWLSQINIEHNNSTNKVKTTNVSTSICSEPVQSSISDSDIQKKQEKKFSEPNLGDENRLYLVEKIEFKTPYFLSENRGNSPPKYILYQRLKISLA